MAERRMFAKTVIDTDVFLEMPATSQMLYFHLAMRADDDGFVDNPKRIMRMVGASEDDMRVLISKQFIVAFENGIIVIRHWKLHNYIQKDRYHETIYKDEKSRLSTDETGAYRQLDTECIQDVSKVYPQDRLGKDRLGKDRLGETNKTVLTDSMSHSRWDSDECIELWNSLSSLGISSITGIKPNTERAKLFAKRSQQYTMDDYRTAIENIRSSVFLQGQNDNGWAITFDWFIKPNNFAKVLEGNYANRAVIEKPRAKTEEQKHQEYMEMWKNL